MEMTLNMGAFEAIDNNEMFAVNGGGQVNDALKITVGAVLVAWSPVIAIAGSIVATPVGGVLAGVGVCGMGLALIGSGTHAYRG
nr:hypothetical protein [Clostridia bacterium]